MSAEPGTGKIDYQDIFEKDKKVTGFKFQGIDIDGKKLEVMPEQYAVINEKGFHIGDILRIHLTTVPGTNTIRAEFTIPASRGPIITEGWHSWSSSPVSQRSTILKSDALVGIKPYTERQEQKEITPLREPPGKIHGGEGRSYGWA